jgi:hypothetical protein
MTSSRSPTLIDALHSQGPASDRVDKMGLYGWLVGHWRWIPPSTRMTAPSKTVVEKSISVGCSKVARSKTYGFCRAFSTAPRCGSTIPVSTLGTSCGATRSAQVYMRQIGRARDGDIVQEGKDDAGAGVRWSFTAIKPDSFHWLGERSPDGGATWRLQVEFFAHRVMP